MAIYCNKCGAELQEGQRFCTECGAVMENAAGSPQMQTGQTQAAFQGGADQQPAGQPPKQKKVKYIDPGAPGSDSRYQPITTKGYIGIFLLMVIPILGQILAIIWACGGCRKENKKNLARAYLIMLAITLILTLIIGLAGGAFVKKAVDEVEKEPGGLGSLIGMLAGGDDDGYDGNNEDLQALSELNDLLENLGGEDSGLSDLISSAEDINQEAESKGEGWPKSLRKYPGGEARATASYRTEISGTTEEEMLDWIDDLRKDGFKYKDFYDFGMTEEDMLGVGGWWATDGEIYISLSYADGVVTVDHMTELPDMSGLFG